MRKNERARFRRGQKKLQDLKMRSRMMEMNKQIVQLITEKKLLVAEKSRLTDTITKVARGDIILRYAGSQFAPQGQQVWFPGCASAVGGGNEAPPPPHLYT